ncbi:EAL domain-containing protein [Actinoplanes sp. NPDC051859]|uniref:EAL domain-containing protein n=1 Tax=Actinoplanes sp. NPDC051859 TaxID=3363909 RepID=UPI00378B9FF6
MHIAAARDAAGRDTASTIGGVLEGRSVQPLFQPIVDLETRAVVGVEALARGPAGSALEFPDRLFAAARDSGRLGELDMLCSERALECAVATAHPPPLLFVNAEPAALNQPLSPRLVDLIQAGLPFREVLEFTERALPAVPGSMMRIAAQAQAWGNGLALDDVGVDPMSLALLPVLEPEVIKLDMSLIRDPCTASTRGVCAVVRAEARRTGAMVVAEGIETEDELAVARELGAVWGQGWLFGRPIALDQIDPASYDTSAPHSLRAARPGFHRPAGTPYEAVAASAPATAATPDSVALALARLHDTAIGLETAIVVAALPASTDAATSRSLQDLAGLARSVILLDHPVGEELTAIVLGPGEGYALSTRADHLATTEHLPTVAEVTRMLLNRLP